MVALDQPGFTTLLPQIEPGFCLSRKEKKWLVGAWCVGLIGKVSAVQAPGSELAPPAPEQKARHDG